MSSWQTGTPDQPGLYLTLEQYAYTADVSLRVFGANHQWRGHSRPKPQLWMPFPYPPGYRPQPDDEYAVIQEATDA